MTAASKLSVGEGKRHGVALLEFGDAAPCGRCARESELALARDRRPATAAGAQRSTISSVKAPLPQPTSIQRRPGRGASQSRKTSPASRLQIPIIRS